MIAQSQQHLVTVSDFFVTHGIVERSGPAHGRTGGASGPAAGRPFDYLMKMLPPIFAFYRVSRAKDGGVRLGSYNTSITRLPGGSIQAGWGCSQARTRSANRRGGARRSHRGGKRGARAGSGQ